MKQAAPTPYFPCYDPPPVGSQLWVIGQSVTQDEEPFSATVLEVTQESYRQATRNRIKLRGFRNKPDAEWSLPQGSFGFGGLYFRTEVECRTSYLESLQAEERRAKNAAKKLAERIQRAKEQLQAAEES